MEACVVAPPDVFEGGELDMLDQANSNSIAGTGYPRLSALVFNVNRPASFPAMDSR